MPTDIPEASAFKVGRSVPKPLLIVALVVYALAAIAMLHAMEVATPDVFLTSAP